MKSIYYLLYAVCFSLVLVACSSSNRDDRSDDNEPDSNALSIVGALGADDEPAVITEELEADIKDIFGEADDETTDVLENDSVQAVIDRARAN